MYPLEAHPFFLFISLPVWIFRRLLIVVGSDQDVEPDGVWLCGRAADVAELEARILVSLQGDALSNGQAQVLGDFLAVEINKFARVNGTGERAVIDVFIGLNVKHGAVCAHMIVVRSGAVFAGVFLCLFHGMLSQAFVTSGEKQERDSEKREFKGG